MTVDHWQALFDHTYLRWFDLNGQPALCEIVDVQERVEMTLPGGAKTRKPVVRMKQIQGKAERARDADGKELPTLKPLVLNVTNGGKIAEICGVAPSGWPGKRIVLYPDTVQMWKNKKKVDEPCIRIRAEKSAAG